MFVLVYVVVIINESLVYELHAARRRVIACEIPVSIVVRYGRMQTFYALVNKLYRRSDSCWAEHCNHLFVKLIHGERLIQVFDATTHLLLWLLQFFHAVPVSLVNQGVHSTILQEGYARTESDELFKAGHVYTIIIWVANLRRRTYDDYLLWM